MTLFEKIGTETIRKIDALNRKKAIIAVNHEPSGAVLVLSDASLWKINGLDLDETKRLIGYLGFFGKGEEGLEPPAFFAKPIGS